MANIESFLKSVQLPVMPEAAQALIRTLSDDNADVQTVSAIVAKDPVLTASLLRMANSAIFGLSRSVNTLDLAISVVGMAQIRARALSICMAKAFLFPPGMNRLDFWTFSMVCAGYSKWLADELGMDSQQAWLTGMMLRLGEVMIGQRMPDQVERIELPPCGPNERWKREHDLIGFDEGQVSAAIARRWDFPEAVALGLQSAAQPLSNAASGLGAVVHLAAMLTDQHFNARTSLDDLPILVVQSLGLNIQKMQSNLPDAESFCDISMLQG